MHYLLAKGSFAVVYLSKARGHGRGRIPIPVKPTGASEMAFSFLICFFRGPQGNLQQGSEQVSGDSGMQGLLRPCSMLPAVAAFARV